MCLARSVVADEGVVGSRSVVEACSTSVATAQLSARVYDRSASRTRRIVKYCLAANITFVRSVVKNACVSAGRGCGVEDYPASVTRLEGLQNAAFVGDGGPVKNKFAP